MLLHSRDTSRLERLGSHMPMVVDIALSTMPCHSRPRCTRWIRYHICAPFVPVARYRPSRYPFRSMSRSPTRATLHKLPGRSVLSWPDPASRIVAALVFTGQYDCLCALLDMCTDCTAESFPIPKSVDEHTAPALRAESTIYERPISLDCEPERSAACQTPQESPQTPGLTRHLSIRR